MILTTFSDKFNVTIAHRLKFIFASYAIISLGASILVFAYPTPNTYFEIVYFILFPMSVVLCAYRACRPRIGSGSIFLFPLFVGSLVRDLDLWINYFDGNNTLEQTIRGSVGWTFLIVSIAYIDLLESRIYHRMVAYIDQEAK